MGELTNKDQEHLKLLSLFHYVVSGIAALFALFPVIHVTIGIMALTHPDKLFGEKAATPPPPFVGWMFIILGGIFILTGLTYAILLAFAGSFIKKRKHRLFCLVMAGWSCMFMPFGTALCVFTFAMLFRPEVKEQFK